MNVLLVSPSSPFLIDSKVFPPLGLLYLGTALEANNHTVSVADLAFGHDRLKGHNPDLIGIMALTAHYPGLRDLIAECRSLYAGVPVVVGGPHFSTCAADGAKVGADATCVGDGEEQILAMAADAALGRLKPIYQSPKAIVDVDAHPIPARHLVDIYEYRYFMDGTRSASIVGQRGCPYECTFCSHWAGYRTIRMRQIDNVVDEVRMLKKMGFGGIMFYDDEVNIVHKRTVALAEAMKGEHVKWRAFIKSNLFNDEQAKAFGESGCWELCTGVESGSDTILKTIKKKATVADNTRARRLCKENGIRFKAFAMIGHPGETEETAMATRDWLLENRPDEFDLSVYTPYLGTPVVENPVNFDIKFNLHYDKEEFFYKGKPGEYQANASTSALSAQRITQLRDSISAEVRDALGLAPLAPPALMTARPADTVTQECH